MPMQEQRITVLEQATAEYRPVLQNIAYELTMVKGITIDQVKNTQEMKQSVDDMKESLVTIEKQLDVILTLLKLS